MAEKIVVLCSGGFDSIVMLNELMAEGRSAKDVFILFFNYHQHNYEQEHSCVRKITEKYDIPNQNIIEIELPCFSWANSSLTNDVENPHSLESQYLPMRNMIFYAYALSVAQSKHCTAIYSAILFGGSYSDTKKEFLSNIAELSKGIGVEFRFPYVDYTKFGIAGVARMFGVRKSDFFSCNTPNADGSPCGECDDCKAIDYIVEHYIEDNYPRQIITRNHYHVTTKYIEAYKNYKLEEIRMLINNQCNTSCKHCFYGFKEMLNEPLTLAEWKDVISQAAKLNSHMNFHFSGKEPLFDEKIFELTDYIDSLNSTTGTSLTYDMVTNGINVSRYSHEIEKRNFTRIALSVDYEGCTRTNAGSAEFYTIQLLNSIKVPVHCFIVAHNDNVSKIVDMIYKLYHDLGVKNIFIKDVIDIGSGKNMSLLPTSQYEKLYDDLIAEFANDDYKDLEIIFYIKGRHFWKLQSSGNSQLAEDLDLWEITGDDYFYDGRIVLRPEYTCSRYLSQVSVTPDGYVLGCGTELANPNYSHYSSGRLFIDGDLKSLVDKGRVSALQSIKKCNCKNNIVCFHKI